jgi:hypothetical protein
MKPVNRPASGEINQNMVAFVVERAANFAEARDWRER